ncbi:glycogen/starch/alpha-glucan phosphorylase [Sulfurirhabdus autotrophica]|uniref:Alpha-1,4 glucan phosphorylase n=1 Tax=Sulfurirhabdus autotrophica TaxID=1706046 RepID=A0A4R3YCX6_9PROT|nr:glycogen/starch/alpha-glucan phosphorylase [Sulfurirhabdus autotrophica]TCV88948.1 glycogen phosphorylase [Sulfurirhabdus autotrophica]
MKKTTKTTSFSTEPLGLDAIAIKQSLANRLTFSVGKDPRTATDRDWFNALSYTVRDRLIERWMETMRSYYQEDSKRVYYFSLEFLIGRVLINSLNNVGFYDECVKSLEEFGLDIEDLRELEPDAALGNGGLGRLAACFLDSMASIGIPGYGCGIRYEYGMFHQRIEDGRQVEHPDNWLRYGNSWEFPRPEVLFPVSFYGHVVDYKDSKGNTLHHWEDAEEVMAMAYDTPVPGYRNGTVNNMRLWSAKASRDFNLKYFNEGNYIKAVEDKNDSENLSKVLYPDDSTEMGRELRLKQQYFFVSASLQDIIFRFHKHHNSFDTLPDKVAIQLNDTHPSIAVPELMRLLLDTYHLGWNKAWSITQRTFSYTNHTLMPEALETWPLSMFGTILPRHLQIIYEINHRFLKDVMHQHPGDCDLLRRMSIIDETGEKKVRMAHLAFVGSHKVNGVARIHTELMKTTIFVDFHRFFPDRIINMTNGVTPRLWLQQANPLLSKVINSHIGDKWVTDLTQLKKLIPLADNAKCRKQFREVKHANKVRLASLIKQHMDIEVNPHSLFDVQIKRIHEYKRQLLNILHIITRYNRIRHNPDSDMVPRTIIFGGKAAPGYALAKLIIKLINDVADIINNDPAVRGLLKVVFIPNYDVSTALDIIPAADLSEQISTAGTEASGTSNMKLALNGALTIGTMDGANVEICEEVGKDNIFIFGLNTEEVAERYNQGYQPWDYYHGNHELKAVLDMISNGFFSPEEPSRFRPIMDNLTTHGDHYLLLADYDAYISCQQNVDVLYRDTDEWSRKTIINIANMGKFSSDRTIQQYASEIWGIKTAGPQKG